MDKDLSEKTLDHEQADSLKNASYSGKKRLDLNDLLKRNKDIRKHNNVQNLIIYSVAATIFSIIALTYIFIKF